MSRRAYRIGSKTANRPSQADQEFVLVTTPNGKELRRNEAYNEKAKQSAALKRISVRESPHDLSQGGIPDDGNTRNLSTMKAASIDVKGLNISDDEPAPVDTNIDRLAHVLNNKSAFEGVSQAESIENLMSIISGDQYADGNISDARAGNTIASLRSLGIVENDGKGSRLGLTTYGQQVFDAGQKDPDMLRKGLLYAASRRPEIGLTDDERREAWKDGAWSDWTKNDRLSTSSKLRREVIEAGFEPRESSIGDAKRGRQGSQDSRTPLERLSDVSMDPRDFMNKDQRDEYSDLQAQIKKKKLNGESASDLIKQRRRLVSSVVQNSGIAA